MEISATSSPAARPPSRWIGPALIALAAVLTALWLPLHHWYGLRSHWDIQYFAFDKVKGGDGEPALTPALRWTGVIFLALGLLYCVGYVFVARLTAIGRWAKLGIVLIGLGPAAVNVDIYPVGALDVFRYMVALKQYLYYGENPYTHGFTQHKDDPFAVHSFLLTLPNAKGPAWLILSTGAAKIGGFSDPLHMLIALKVFNVLLIAATAAVAARAFDKPAHRWLAAYAIWANPLVLFEGVANVHNDVMIALFVVAAIVALKRDSWLAMPLLAVSVLVKYFTIQLGPLLLFGMIGRKWPIRKIAFSIGAAAIVCVAFILPFWSGGDMVSGIQDVGGAYNRSSHVSIISLVRQYRIQGLSTDDARKISEQQPLFAVIFIALAEPFFWRARRGGHLVQTAIDLTLLFLILLSLLYPWYLITVVALLALKRDPINVAYLFVMTTLGLVYYTAYVWAWFGSGLDRLHRHLYLSMFLMIPIFAYWIVRGGRWLWQHRGAIAAYRASTAVAAIPPGDHLTQHPKIIVR